MSTDGPPQGANYSPSGGSAAATSASLDLRRESLQRESASCDDSHLPSIPAARGPSPAVRATAARVGVLP
jgi:hypothetical protein